jgi:hypothetical protein
MMTDWEYRWLPMRRHAVRVMLPGEWFSIYARWNPYPRRFHHWYVNFERPFVRKPFGFDTCDLELDIDVQPDFSWEWKDRDHLVAARDAGHISHADAKAVEHATADALQMLDRREFPFSERWEQWAPDPDWPAPRLPNDPMTVPGIDTTA